MTTVGLHSDPLPGVAPNRRVIFPPAAGRTRRLVTLLLAVAGALLAATAVAGPAAAHATLASSDPASGARLEESPRQLTLDYTESVTLVEGGLRLVDSNGDRVALGPAREDGRTLVVPLPRPLSENGYVLSWRVLSADSHPVSGSIPFTVGDAEPAAVAEAAGSSSRAAETALAVARWIGLVGLILMLGPVLFVILCWRGGGTDRRTARLVVTGAGALLLGTTTGLLAQGPYVAGMPATRAVDLDLLSATLRSTYGQASIVRLLAVLALLLLMESLRRRASVLAGVAAGAAAAGLFLSYAVQGHSIAATNRMLAVASDTLHLAALTTWIGGLAMLAVLLRARSVSELPAVLPRWSRAAQVSVAVLVGTGTYQSWREVGSLDALTGTPYGRILLVKLCLFAGLLALGNMGRVWIRRHYTMKVVHAYSEKPPPDADPDLGRLRRSVTLEAALGAVVVAVSAALVATTPGRVAARDLSPAAMTERPVAATFGLPNGTKVAVDATPARIVTIRLSAEDGTPLDPDEVTASASSPDLQIPKLSLQLSRAQAGLYRADRSPLPFAGDWRVTVTVRTSELEASVGTATLTIP